MRFASLTDYLKRGTPTPQGPPLALVLVEDDVEVDSTLYHHLKAGFDPVISLMPASLDLPDDLESRVVRIDGNTTAPGAMEETVTRLAAAAPGRWMYYCFNAEYLFFPFCETRTVGEMLAFHTEERRDAMLTYVIDLYADDLTECPNAVSLERAHLDRSGYYALARQSGAHDGAVKDRQLDFFGGLRWRFEEFVPPERRRIDRISLFRAKKDLRLLPDHRFTDEEYNTYACPWHHNLTAAICSFRAAKALRRNAGSRDRINTFKWRNSESFEWHSQQLLDLGLMEPGQWF